MAAGKAPEPSKLSVGKSVTVNVNALPVVTGPSTVGPIATEIQKPKRLGSSPLRRDPAAGDVVPLTPGMGSPTSSGKKAKSNPEVNVSFEGVNHRDSRLAFGGNQFSGEPADQGLCVGNGYILESVNSALRVYDAGSGAPLSPVVALNEFYGFPPAIDRSTFTFGPFTFDIGCHYDPATNRWFHLAVDLDQDPVTGAFTGKNYLDLAVSTSGDPTGDWKSIVVVDAHPARRTTGVPAGRVLRTFRTWVSMPTASTSRPMNFPCLRMASLVHRCMPYRRQPS